MELSSVAQNVLSPAFLFFLLGFGAVLARSDLEIPHPLPKLFSLYLLLSIGYTGGEKLASSGLTWSVGLYVLGAMAMASLVPLGAFFLLRRFLSVYDAAVMAATYGSVSLVTFVVATEFLQKAGVPYGGYMVAILSLMESPAVIMGIALVRLFAPKDASADRPGAKAILHESFLNGTVYLLLGSLLVGAITGPSAGKSLAPFTTGIFKGMLLFFLLDTGMLAARRAKALKALGPRLAAFALVAPPLNAAAALGLAALLGMGPGDGFLLAILCASASYIVVPAAMRQAVPEATPGLAELLALSVTFPFNIAVGIPLYWAAAERLLG